jgi:hypothetical protein
VGRFFTVIEWRSRNRQTVLAAKTASCSDRRSAANSTSVASTCSAIAARMTARYTSIRCERLSRLDPWHRCRRALSLSHSLSLSLSLFPDLADRARYRDTEPVCRCTAGQATINRRNYPRSQIFRYGFRHAWLASASSAHDESDFLTKRNPDNSIRSDYALA